MRDARLRRRALFARERDGRRHAHEVLEGDVATDDALYGVAIGTKNGDIELSDTRTLSKAFYSRKRDELAQFLNVPARPTA